MTDCEQFRADMKRAGFQVREYAGRFYWRGPAVYADIHELQDVIRATSVRLQTDQLGKHQLVIYPESYS